METPICICIHVYIYIRIVNKNPLPYIPLHRIALPCIAAYTMVGQMLETAVGWVPFCMSVVYGSAMHLMSIHTVFPGRKR